ncbi:ECF RNA polymerase sigma factor SigR [mine drainage metagenome]|jgi:RNA polymerase sigma-70 factor (ECF subfamily)|uniref:ECF RNA polymerase sigma factor SigR n=1 Tax=mine drainage metagenome TaxID=410659 RepID=A0A1J5R7U4_9ZZZZ
MNRSTFTPNDLLRQIEATRPTLMRLALLQLRNPAWAEDAVSETLLAAMEGLSRFANQSKLQTWVVGILKNKVLDQLRLHQRECAYAAADDEDLEDAIYAPDGHFREMPVEWGLPDQAVRQSQFLKVLEACMDALPGQLGRVFLMREWLEFDTAEICQELGLSSTNVWQMLSRARLRLRQCLQAHWFSPSTS